MELRRAVLFAAVLSFTTLAAALPAAAAEGPVCLDGQSPRLVDPRAEPSPYQLVGVDSFLARADDETTVYLPRPGGPEVTLHRCGQHYHFPIENPQGCGGETGEYGEGKPGPGSRIEIHTVYAANDEHPRDCDPETLACCTTGPFLVRAFSATIAERGGDGPISPPAGRPLAEWSGSTTGAESRPGECKPAAQWSLRLGCGFTVSAAQVERFHHVDPARPVQQGERLSRDLTLVGRRR